MSDLSPVEIDWLRAHHVPTRLLDKCFVPPGVRFGEQYEFAYVCDDAHHGPLSERELVLAATTGLGVRFVWDRPENLARLSPYLEGGGRALEVGSQSGLLSGWHVVESAADLESFRGLFEPGTPVDLSRLRNLRTVAVRGARSWVSVFELEGLVTLGYETTSQAAIPRIPAELEWLSIESGRRIDSLGFIERPSRLRELHLTRGGVFDASWLLEMPNLEGLHLVSWRQLINTEALRELPSLRRVTLASISSVERPAVLANLSLERLDTVGVRMDDRADVGSGRPGVVSDAHFGIFVLGADRSQVRFDHWEILEERAEQFGVVSGAIDSGFAESLLIGLLDEDARRMVTFDSEGDTVIFECDGPGRAVWFVQKIVASWNDDDRFAAALAK
jgi:hypothetical protein